MMALMKWAQWEVFRSWVGKLALGDEVLKKGVARQEGSAPLCRLPGSPHDSFCMLFCPQMPD